MIQNYARHISNLTTEAALYRIALRARSRRQSLAEALENQEAVRAAIAARRQAREEAMSRMRSIDSTAGESAVMYVIPRRIQDPEGVRFIRTKVFSCSDRDDVKEALRSTYGTDIFFVQPSGIADLESSYRKELDRYNSVFANEDRSVVLSAGRPEKTVVICEGQGLFVSADAFDAKVEAANRAVAQSSREETTAAFSRLVDKARECNTEFHSKKIGWRERDPKTDGYRQDCFPFIRDSWFIEVSPETETVRICRQMGSHGVQPIEEFTPNYKSTSDADRFFVTYDGDKSKRMPVSVDEAMHSVSYVIFRQYNVERCKSALKEAGMYFKQANQMKEEKVKDMKIKL